MNVFLFQNRFEQPILDRVKGSTIRGHRKDGRPRAKAGERISLRVWTGKPYRSKQREICQKTVQFTFPILIEWGGVFRVSPGEKPVHLVPRLIARGEGFKNWKEMRAWFSEHHGLPFSGVLTKWEDGK